MGERGREGVVKLEVQLELEQCQFRRAHTASPVNGWREGAEGGGGGGIGRFPNRSSTRRSSGGKP